MSFQDQWEDKIPPTLELENEWESNDVMCAKIAAMIILIDAKRTDDLLVCDVFSFVFWENPRPEKNVSRFTDL